jgi:hypothetical protein
MICQSCYERISCTAGGCAVNFIHHEDPSAAKLQPKVEISRAKTQRRKGKNQKFPNLASWRLGAKYLPSDLRAFVVKTGFASLVAA